MKCRSDVCSLKRQVGVNMQNCFFIGISWKIGGRDCLVECSLATNTNYVAWPRSVFGSGLVRDCLLSLFLQIALKSNIKIWIVEIFLIKSIYPNLKMIQHSFFRTPQLSSWFTIAVYITTWSLQQRRDKLFPLHYVPFLLNCSHL